MSCTKAPPLRATLTHLCHGRSPQWDARRAAPIAQRPGRRVLLLSYVIRLSFACWPDKRRRPVSAAGQQDASAIPSSPSTGVDNGSSEDRPGVGVHRHGLAAPRHILFLESGPADPSPRAQSVAPGRELRRDDDNGRTRSAATRDWMFHGGSWVLAQVRFSMRGTPSPPPWAVERTSSLSVVRQRQSVSGSSPSTM